MKIALKQWQPEYEPYLVKYGNNAAIASNLTNTFPHPYTPEKAAEFVKMVTAQKPTQVFAICLEEEPIGAIGIFPQSDIMCKNAELGYWIGEPFWGRGIAQTAIGLMIDYAFQTWDITRIYARPFGTNTQSQRVLEKCGFKLEGRFDKTIFKNGVFLDELVYAVRRQP